MKLENAVNYLIIATEKLMITNSDAKNTKSPLWSCEIMKILSTIIKIVLLC